MEALSGELPFSPTPVLIGRASDYSRRGDSNSRGFMLRIPNAARYLATVYALLLENGSSGWDRTNDQLINSQLILPLSYAGMLLISFIFITHVLACVKKNFKSFYSKTFSYYLNHGPTNQLTMEYLTPLVTGSTPCRIKDGNTSTVPAA